MRSQSPCTNNNTKSIKSINSKEQIQNQSKIQRRISKIPRCIWYYKSLMNKLQPRASVRQTIFLSRHLVDQPNSVHQFASQQEIIPLPQEINPTRIPWIQQEITTLNKPGMCYRRPARFAMPPVSWRVGKTPRYRLWPIFKRTDLTF